MFLVPKIPRLLSKNVDAFESFVLLIHFAPSYVYISIFARNFRLFYPLDSMIGTDFDLKSGLPRSVRVLKSKDQGVEKSTHSSHSPVHYHLHNLPKRTAAFSSMDCSAFCH